jgi:quercetin dioxygenase-like cupin family protein
MTALIAPRFEVVYDGASVNVYHANKGQGLPKHEHAFSHLTMCTAGSCVIRKEGKEVVVTKDTQPINLVAKEWHEIEALEDGTVFINVFAEGKY